MCFLLHLLISATIISSISANGLIFFSGKDSDNRDKGRLEYTNVKAAKGGQYIYTCHTQSFSPILIIKMIDFCLILTSPKPSKRNTESRPHCHPKHIITDVKKNLETHVALIRLASSLFIFNDPHSYVL